jgi:hypothetical protein
MRNHLSDALKRLRDAIAHDEHRKKMSSKISDGLSTTAGKTVCLALSKSANHLKTVTTNEVRGVL